MPDVFTSWADSVSNIGASGVTAVYAKATGTVPDTAYYILGNVVDPDISIEWLSKEDTILRPQGYAAKVSAKFPVMQAGSTEIKLLHNFCTRGGYQPVLLRADFPNGVYLNDTTGILAPTWKVICDGDANGFRMIEYTWSGTVKATEVDGLVASSGTALGTPNVADVLYGLGQSTIQSDQVSNGLTKFEFKASTDAAYVDTNFRNGKYTFETIGGVHGGGRNLPISNAIKWTCEVELLESDLTKLELMDSIRSNKIDFKLTHFDGAVLTMSSARVNGLCSFENKGNIDKEQVMRFKAQGTIYDLTTWAGLWT